MNKFSDTKDYIPQRKKKRLCVP